MGRRSVALEQVARHDIELLGAIHELAMPGLLDAPESCVSDEQAKRRAADAHVRGDDHSAV